MKLNLLYHSDNLRNGYRNIDPFAVSTEGQGDVFDLNWIVDDAECTEIIASDVIDYVPAKEVDEVLNHWAKKLRHGGILTVGGVDQLLVAKAIVARTLDLDSASLLLYGEQKAPWQYRKRTYTVSYIAQKLFDIGLVVMTRRLIDLSYIVTAQRK